MTNRQPADGSGSPDEAGSSPVVILVVDDDDAFRAVAAEVLTDAGFEVIEAPTGEEGIRQTAKRPEVVVLDVNLPDLSGLEVCRMIKTNPTTEGISVIMVSGLLVASEARSDGLETGADAYLTKPVAVRELLATVRALLRMRRAEARLRESEQRFRAVVETARDAIISSDSRGNVTTWNKAAEAIFGYSAVEVLGRPLTLIIPRGPFDAAEQAPTVGHTVELVGRQKGGAAFPIEISLSSWAARDENGFTAIIRDVSERKRVEEALRSAQDEISARLLSSTLDLGEMMPRLVEIARSVVGVDLVSILLSEDGDASIRIHASIGAHGGDLDHRTAFSAGQGLVGWIVAHKVPLALAEVRADARLDNRSWFEAEGIESFLGVPLLIEQTAVGVLTCMSRTRRQWSAQDVERAETLGRHAAIAIRNAQLYERLRTQVRELERLAYELTEVARVKEDFLVNVSHELGTPLTAIKAYVDTLCADPKIDLATRRQFFKVLQDEVDRLARLVGNILDASRLEIGLLDFTMATVDVAEIAARVARETQARRPIGYESAGPLPVKGDGDRLTQVLLNLVDNAIKFSPADQPVLIRTSQENDEAVVRVLDRGPGVPEDHEGRLFQKFGRLHRPGAEGRAGSGLGLYLANEIVKEHKGVIRIERHSGWGAVFAVRIPSLRPDS